MHIIGFVVLLVLTAAWVSLSIGPGLWMRPYKKRLQEILRTLQNCPSDSREVLTEIEGSLASLELEVEAAKAWWWICDLGNSERNKCLKDIDNLTWDVRNMINTVDVTKELDEIEPLLESDPTSYVRDAMDIYVRGWTSSDMVKDKIRTAVQMHLMPLVYQGDKAAVEALNEWLIHQDRK